LWSRRIAILFAAGALMTATLLVGGAFAAVTSWSGGTYVGHGTGVWPKNAVTLEVSATGKAIPTYDFKIDTLCGQSVSGVESARETEIWPFTSQGSPAIPVAATGAFESTQRGSFTVSAIPTVMSQPEPGTYKFSVSGTLHHTTFSGHLTLMIETKNGKYFCTDTNSAFGGARVAAKS
jgi:hypothetical protein